MSGKGFYQNKGKKGTVSHKLEADTAFSYLKQIFFWGGWILGI